MCCVLGYDHVLRSRAYHVLRSGLGHVIRKQERQKERKHASIIKRKRKKDTSAMLVSRHYPPSKIHCPQWSARCLDTGPSPIPSLYLLVYGFQASAMEGS